MRNIEHLSARSNDTLLRFDAGERLFIFGFRSMAHHYRCGRPAIAELRQVYCHFGIEDAVCSLDSLLEAFARSAHTAIEIHSPGCPCVSGCERFLLRAVSAAQSNALTITRREFERWLPATAADWATAPACGLGKVFRAAGLILPLRGNSQGALSNTTNARSWTDRSRTLH
jgi:hypothetical protein